MDLNLKFVIILQTTRSESQIRAALADYYDEARARLQALADADPQTTIMNWDYALNIDGIENVSWPNIMQVYPKLLLELDTTRTFEQILGAMESFYADARDVIRGLVAGDPQTAIRFWHYHLLVGSADHNEGTGEVLINV